MGVREKPFDFQQKNISALENSLDILERSKKMQVNGEVDFFAKFRSRGFRECLKLELGIKYCLDYISALLQRNLRNAIEEDISQAPLANNVLGLGESPIKHKWQAEFSFSLENHFEILWGMFNRFLRDNFREINEKNFELFKKNNFEIFAKTGGHSV